MKPDFIKNALKLHGYGIAIEVTNGTSLFSYKTLEAKWGKSFLQDLSGIKIESGIIFFRETAPYFATDIDHVLQLKTYEKERTIKALENTLKRKLTTKEEKITNDFLTLVRQEIRFEDIAYPKQWRQFKSDFPNLTTKIHSPKDYADHIAQVKGAFLEEYVNLLFEDLAPDAIKIPRYKYQRDKKRCADIDLIVIGKKRQIKDALQNIAQFSRTNQLENPFSRSESQSGAPVESTRFNT